MVNSKITRILGLFSLTVFFGTTPVAHADVVLNFICNQSPDQVIRPSYKDVVTGSLDAAFTPFNVTATRVLSHWVEANTERGTPAPYWENDSLNGVLNRFDISNPVVVPPPTPTAPNIYYLDIPKGGLSSGSSFVSYLDVLYAGGSSGWNRFKLACKAYSDSELQIAP